MAGCNHKLPMKNQCPTMLNLGSSNIKQFNNGWIPLNLIPKQWSIVLKILLIKSKPNH